VRRAARPHRCGARARWRCPPARTSVPPRQRFRRGYLPSRSRTTRCRARPFDPGAIGQPWLRGQAAGPGLADERIAFELLRQQAHAPPVLGHDLLTDFIEAAGAVEEHRDIVARLQEHLAGQHRRARLGETLHVAVEHAAQTMAAVAVADHHAIDVDEARVAFAEPAEVGTGVLGVFAERDQETRQATFDFGHAEIVRPLEKMPQACGIERQDRGACAVVEGEHGIQVGLADITNDNGHCNSQAFIRERETRNAAVPWTHFPEFLPDSTRPGTWESRNAPTIEAGAEHRQIMTRAARAVMLRSIGDRNVTGRKRASSAARRRAAGRGRLSYHRGVLPRHALNHIRLLRYAGLFTYACVGVPLISRDWMLSRLGNSQVPDQFDQLQQQVRSHTDVLLWAVCYVIFGVVYWLLTRDLGSRRHWAAKLLGLVVLTGAAIAIGWFSQSGLSALLLMVVCVVLPLLLPLSIGVVWLVLQNLALIPVFASFPGFDAAKASL